MVEEGIKAISVNSKVQDGVQRVQDGVKYIQDNKTVHGVKFCFSSILKRLRGGVDQMLDSALQIFFLNFKMLKFLSGKLHIQNFKNCYEYLTCFATLSFFGELGGGCTGLPSPVSCK